MAFEAFGQICRNEGNAHGRADESDEEEKAGGEEPFVEITKKKRNSSYERWL